MTVDRSYHPSKAIREYQDRGMMKWQGFFLSEHTAAMKEWTEEEARTIFPDSLSMEEKISLLTQSMLNRVEIDLQMQPGRLEDEKIGIVKEFIDQETFLFESEGQKIMRLKTTDILKIQQKN